MGCLQFLQRLPPIKWPRCEYFLFYLRYCFFSLLRSLIEGNLEICPDTYTVMCLQIELNFFDAASSSTASLVSCSDAMCASIVQTAAAKCSAQNNLCSYSFQYGDGSGTSGYYVTDLLSFDTVMGPSLVANSSAPVVFGYADMTSSGGVCQYGVENDSLDGCRKLSGESKGMPV